MSKYVDKYCLDVCLKTSDACQFHKGHDRYSFQDVILKIFKLDWLRGNEFVHSKIMNESAISDKLEHPSIVKTLGCLQTKNNMYLVYEYFVEGNLKNYIQRKSKIELLEATVKLRKMLEILIYLKSRNVIHRDLRSSSFLIKNNEVFLSNFFNAIEISKEESDSSEVWNNQLAFTSPENYFSHIYTFKSDLFSVGVIFYEMLTGQTPFSSSDIKSLNGKIPETDFRNAARSLGWSVELVDFLKRIMAQNPEKRFGVEEALAFIDKHFSKITKVENNKSIETLFNKQEIIFRENFEIAISKIHFLNKFGDFLSEINNSSELANILLFFVLKIVYLTISNFVVFSVQRNWNKAGWARESLKLEELVVFLQGESMRQLETMQTVLRITVDVFANQQLFFEIENLDEVRFWQKIKKDVVAPLMLLLKQDWGDFTGARMCEEFVRFYEYSAFQSGSEFNEN